MTTSTGALVKALPEISNGGSVFRTANSLTNPSDEGNSNGDTSHPPSIFDVGRGDDAPPHDSHHLPWFEATAQFDPPDDNAAFPDIGEDEVQEYLAYGDLG
jgi:hypothetical protein